MHGLYHLYTQLKRGTATDPVVSIVRQQTLHLGDGTNPGSGVTLVPPLEQSKYALNTMVTRSASFHDHSKLIIIVIAIIVSTCCACACRSTKGASRMRRSCINREIVALRELLPVAECTKQRLSQLQTICLSCVYIRKSHYFERRK